ncbi:MAG TPA: hypothetical protein DCR43_09010 [Bacteroidales bacterium]|nr:MAG: hypothetical protein A2X11_05135 [Bacteroidetes bacterium GWE2_42_24]OFY26598.1 MAG: hypothetical protein A2X09_03435 [Bacteroidetes bacterium GWF2_43_11]PKP22395.1 MAG: hypothetical protein CVU06_09480 [Bacteroidetes bacterium HGW-Bacteroidetes-22]HAQ65972.1 hypothetical protein [Bacteroidales bacterium]HBZ67478.1 hypothetical protein [Bacteroidales bacterium]
MKKFNLSASDGITPIFLFFEYHIRHPENEVNNIQWFQSYCSVNTSNSGDALEVGVCQAIAKSRK